MPFISLLMLTSLLFVPPNFNRWTKELPYRAKWGPYTIVVETTSGDPHDKGNPQRVCIRDRRGRLLKQLRGIWVIEAKQVELTGRPSAELHLQFHTGGAYASVSDAYFTGEGGLRNMTVIYGEDLGVRSIKDLNGDGTPEIIVENPALGDFSGYNFHRHWPLVTVLEWNGKRYRNATQRYPKLALQQAQEMRKNLLKVWKEPAQERREWDEQDKVTAYYANMLAAGKGAEGRRWLKQHLSPKMHRWIQRKASELRRLVRNAMYHRCRTTQARTIDMSRSLHRRESPY